LGVGVVGRGGFDEGDQVLVEEDLADVRGVGGGVAAEEGAVGADGGGVGRVGEDVDVGGACEVWLAHVLRNKLGMFSRRLTAGVVARENGFVLGDTVDIGFDDSTQESVVQVSEVFRVTVAVRCDTRIDSCCVAVPKVHVDSRDRLARAGVDQLNIKVKRDTLLTIGDVATDKLAIDVVGTLSNLRLEDTGRVVGEKKSLVVTVGDARSRLVGVVVSGEVAVDERGADAALGAGLAGHCLAAGEGVLHVASAAELRSAGADGLGGSLHVLAALEGLFGDIVAWVCEDGRQGEETKGQKRRHGRHC
jgi:hypothetical protein